MNIVLVCVVEAFVIMMLVCVVETYIQDPEHCVSVYGGGICDHDVGVCDGDLYARP